MKEIKHKWWHFIYGSTEKDNVTYQKNNYRSIEFWDECKKCGEQVGKKQAVSTFTFNVPFKIKKEER